MTGRMNSPMLSDEKTLEYIRAAKEGDSFAKEELITHNTSLIKSIVKRYLNKGVDYDDLFQLASMGLLKAITGFDESYGVKFSTYAVPRSSVSCATTARSKYPARSNSRQKT